MSPLFLGDRIMAAAPQSPTLRHLPNGPSGALSAILGATSQYLQYHSNTQESSLE